ncbi:Histone deacetylase 7 [Labeo rohita]|uniref:histone deacetylase n=1 Tax=Labeo rohita TaxID=84645 RepID=A0ABQ8LJF0_LABRO|nr:Histone deacetylase 7 [Labeo rohita]
MDLRVGERLVRPGSDTAFLSPLHPPLLIGFNPHNCSQYSQQQLQHIQPYNMEQHLRDQELAKQQLQQLKNKDKSQQSAVASALVKQKLAQVILKKQKAVLERTNSNPLSTPSVAYRELVPDPSAPVQALLSSTKPSLNEGPDEPPLRRAKRENIYVQIRTGGAVRGRACPAAGVLCGSDPAPLPRSDTLPAPQSSSRQHSVNKVLPSEPNLKVKHKLKKHLNTRKSPLTRKESAPPTIKHRVPDTLVLPATASLSHEAQRLLLQDGSLTHFTVQNPSSLPTITLGLPANAKAESELGSLKLGRVPVVPGGSPVLVPLGVEEQTGPLIQPVLILEPSGLVHTPLLAVPGLGPVPLQFSTSGPHKPLSRTRSEPLPQSPRALHPHLLQQQQHSAQLLERLKQQTHLGKLMSKSSEKPRLRQIPSEDMDSEEVGPSAGDAHQGRARAESQRELESQDEQLNLQHTLILNQSRLWETQKQLQQLRRQTAHMETLAVPMMLGGAHRPLSRTQSSPASTSLTLPDKALPLTTAPEPPQSQPRFTTGLVYDSQMLKHQCTCGDNSSHPEHAGRIQSIWSRLQERGLRGQCESIRGRKATLEELQSVHTERHVLLYGTNPLNRLKLDNRKLAGILSQRMFVMLPCGGVGQDHIDTCYKTNHRLTVYKANADALFPSAADLGSDSTDLSAVHTGSTLAENLEKMLKTSL